MKKLFTIAAAMLLSMVAGSASAQIKLTLGGQSAAGKAAGEGGWSWGWNQTIGAKVDLLFTSQWGEFTLANNLTGAVSYKLVVAEANDKINLVIKDSETHFIGVNAAELTGEVNEGTTLIELQATEANQELSIVSFELIDAAGNATQTTYATNWGVSCYGGVYTSTSQWGEVMVNGVEGFGEQTVTLTANEEIPEGLQWKVIYTEGTESYPQITAGGTTAQLKLEQEVKQLSIQATAADITIDIANVTTTPIADVEIAPESGDISAAIAEKANGALLRNVSITLAEGATYTISSPIVASGNVTIAGNGATIDASALTGALVLGTSEAPATAWETKSVIEISNVTVKGLAQALVASAAKGYLYDFTLDNSVVEVVADVTVFDYTKGSVAENFTVKNSTLYAPTATSKSLYSSQGGQKASEVSADTKQVITFQNNTVYNFAKSKNFFSHRQSNQTFFVYNVENNLFVDCGKSGQVIKGMNQGQGGKNPTWNISGNAFNFDGADTSASEETGDDEETVQNSVAGVVTFVNAAEGDFNGAFALGEDAEAPESLGDARWTLTFASTDGIATVEESNDQQQAVYFNLQGVRVAQPVKGLYIQNGKKVLVK